MFAFTHDQTESFAKSTLWQVFRVYKQIIKQRKIKEIVSVNHQELEEFLTRILCKCVLYAFNIEFL